jgi:hypothetical protein
MSEATSNTATYADKFHAELCAASGNVHDARRLVAWLFLFVRDHAPTSVVGTALMEMAAGEWVNGKREYTQETRDRANRLSDSPTDTLREFLQRIRFAVTDDVWQTLDGMTPLRDDIETTFSNGWIARYCIYITEQLNKDVPKQVEEPAQG